MLTNLPPLRKGLSLKICNTDPSKCPQFEGVFNYMKSWSGGEFGPVDGGYKNGKTYISGPEKRYDI